MFRLALGSLLGGLAQFFVGFVFWGTPLSKLAISRADDGAVANLQAALAQTLTTTGTGTYAIPSPQSGAGTVLYGKGPIAMVHFNTGGFPAMDTTSLVVGFLLSVVTAAMIGGALYVIADKVTLFATRLRVVILFALAATIYLDLGQPVFNHYGPGYFIYLFVSDLLGLVAAGAVIARWFLPAGVAAEAGSTLH
jgi:hypothetical protein